MEFRKPNKFFPSIFILPSGREVSFEPSDKTGDESSNSRNPNPANEAELRFVSLYLLNQFWDNFGIFVNSSELTFDGTEVVGY